MNKRINIMKTAIAENKHSKPKLPNRQPKFLEFYENLSLQLKRAHERMREAEARGEDMAAFMAQD